MKAVALFLVLLGGCTLFADPPSKSCKDDRDCFLAQGERCNAAKVCEVPPDVDAAPAQSELDEMELDVSEVAP